MTFEDLISRNISATDFELHHFVIGAQMAPHRVLRQISLEGSVRENNIKTMTFDLREKKIELARKQVELEMINERSDKLAKFDAEIKEIEIEKVEMSINNIKDTIARNEYELGIIKDHFEKMKASIGEEECDRLLEEKNLYKEEGHYWVERLSRQASNDIIANGRISTGNIDAILNLPDELQSKTLINAIGRTAEIESSIQKEQQKLYGEPQKPQIDKS